MELWEVSFSDGTVERWAAESEEDLDKALVNFCKNCDIKVTNKRKIK